MISRLRAKQYEHPWQGPPWYVSATRLRPQMPILLLSLTGKKVDSISVFDMIRCEASFVPGTPKRCPFLFILWRLLPPGETVKSVAIAPYRC